MSTDCLISLMIDYYFDSYYDFDYNKCKKGKTVQICFNDYLLNQNAFILAYISILKSFNLS